jgi:capsular polysaccharide biosynthesis protein
MLTAGLVAAALAGLLAAFLCDLLRSGYLTPEQLERSTGLPVLASVPLRLQHRPAVLRRW